MLAHYFLFFGTARQIIFFPPSLSLSLPLSLLLLAFPPCRDFPLPLQRDFGFGLLKILVREGLEKTSRYSLSLLLTISELNVEEPKKI